MLQLTVPAHELFDEKTCEFINVPEQTLQLEHSLVSLQKWESKWNKPFLKKENKTRDELIDYIRFMCITKNPQDDYFDYLPDEYFKRISDYINAPMTATTFKETPGQPKSGSHEIQTAELIYYSMIALEIPFECRKWHLNQLLTLIRVCSIKQQPPKKMSGKDALRQNAALNAARRAKHP